MKEVKRKYVTLVLDKGFSIKAVTWAFSAKEARDKLEELYGKGTLKSNTCLA